MTHLRQQDHTSQSSPNSLPIGNQAFKHEPMGAILIQTTTPPTVEIRTGGL